MRLIVKQLFAASYLVSAYLFAHAEVLSTNGKSKTIEYNGIRMGESLSEFTARSDAYSCATNGGRAASCKVLTTTENRCTRDSLGREFCGKVELARAPDLDDKWRYFLGYKINISQTKLNFLDGKLVSLSTIPADDFYNLYKTMVVKFGLPKDFVRRQSFFAAWQQTTDQEDIKMFLSNHPSDSSLTIYDRVGSTDFVAEIKREPLGVFSQPSPLSAVAVEAASKRVTSSQESQAAMRQSGADAEACERAKNSCRSKESPFSAQACLNSLAALRGCR